MMIEGIFSNVVIYSFVGIVLDRREGIDPLLLITLPCFLRSCWFLPLKLVLRFLRDFNFLHACELLLQFFRLFLFSRDDWVGSTKLLLLTDLSIFSLILQEYNKLSPWRASRIDIWRSWLFAGKDLKLNNSFVQRCLLWCVVLNC